MKNTFNTFRFFYIFLPIIMLYGCGRAKKDTELFFIQGNVAYKKGNYEEAIKFYTEAIEKTPKFADAYNNRARVKLELDNLEGAIQDFEKAVSIDDKFYMAKFNLAEAYSNTDKLEESLTLLKQISNQYKDSSFYYVTLSNVLIQKNNFAEANSNLAVALKLNPKNDKAYTNLGYIQYTDKNYDAAKQNFEKAISLNAKQDFALNNLSLIYAQKENYAKALETVEKAIEINKNEIYQNNKAYYLLNLGKLEEGKKLLDLVLEKNKNSAWAFRNLGVYFLKTNDLSSANENFLKSDKIDPTVELLNYYLGLTQQSLGNKSKACEYWSIGQKLNEVKSIEMLSKVCK
ncbi:tetratricopeptide repeat protein [Emticicia sp. W12TSBA100-4]|uniref:tetratricopeptide repeat protein n=1 Tax=Emticicia sp. W12TSBA100-4 TaxID=3160965 RepID=UPI003305703B